MASNTPRSSIDPQLRALLETLFSPENIREFEMEEITTDLQSIVHFELMIEVEANGTAEERNDFFNGLIEDGELNTKWLEERQKLFEMDVDSFIRAGATVLSMGGELELFKGFVQMALTWIARRRAVLERAATEFHTTTESRHV